MTYVFYSPSPMQLSRQGLEALADREGMSLTKYLDSVGVQTIGLGATSSDIKDLKAWSWTKTISVQDAFDMFTKHLQKYVDAVNAVLQVKIEQHQFDAIVSVTYNIGTGIVSQRKGGMAGSTFMRMINNKASPEEVAKAIRMWNKPPEIRKRRSQEANLYVTGNYTGNNGKVFVFDVSSKTHRPIYSKGYEVTIADYI